MLGVNHESESGQRQRGQGRGAERGNIRRPLAPTRLKAGAHREGDVGWQCAAAAIMHGHKEVERVRASESKRASRADTRGRVIAD
jgi:hypothetical protein